MAFWVNALAGAMLAVVCGASLPALAAKVTLSGEVTYLERIALPDGAMLRVRLIDTTAAGTPVRVEAAATIGTAGQAPLSFTLNFDDRVIDPTHEHAIVAEISSGLELWFRNGTPYAVKPLAPEGEVAVLVEFTGRLANSGQAVSEAVAPIVDLNWRAEAIGGGTVDPTVNSTLSIASDMRAGGKGGCNNYFAQAEVGENSVHFSAIASTKMACASAIATEQERRFFEALAAVRFWRMSGDRLIMLAADGREMLRFAVAPR